MASGISLRSTGLMVFGGQMISAITGLVFIVMVARWLDPTEFGIWEVIVTLVTFSSYPVGVVAYWATRDISRGKMIGRTALGTGALISAAGIALYFVFTFITYSKIAASAYPFLLGAILVPLSYWSAVANSVVQGFKPKVRGYSLVISELAKLGAAYETLFVYKMGIEGVLLSLMVAYFMQSLVSTYFVRSTFSEGFDFGQIRRWSRLAWLPALSYLPPVLAVSDSFVAAVGFGPALVGYYQVAFTVASVVGYSSALAFSLYPLLLRGGNERLPGITIEFSLLFSIPMAIGGIVLAKPLLYLFGVKYLPGASGLSILSLMFVFTTISAILDQTLMGTEQVDATERPSLRALTRSNLLFVPLANALYAVVYVVSLFLALFYASLSGFSTAATIALWSVVQFAATVIFMLFKARRAGRRASLMPGRSVVYYLVAGGAMGGVLQLGAGLLNQGAGTLSYGVHLIVLGLAGLVVYFALVFVMDFDFREMLNKFVKRT